MDALAAPSGETSWAVADLLLPFSCATTVAPELLADCGMVNWVYSEPYLSVFPSATVVPWLECAASKRTCTMARGSKPLPCRLT
jgi:hypothetical protein